MRRCWGYYTVEDKMRNESFERQPPESHEAILRELPKRVPICHTVSTFRKQAWKEAGGYPIESNGVADFHFYVRVAEKGWELANVPVNTSTHYVYEQSFWIGNVKYGKRQKALMDLQHDAIKRLNLPGFYHLYPLSRQLYYRAPNSLKTFIRRNLASSKEKQIS